MIIQLTGLSGSGKTTIATRLRTRLLENGLLAEVIDGDIYRSHLCKDLGYSKANRFENMRRLAKAAFELSQRKAIAIISAINPYDEIRLEIKRNYGAHLVYVHCTLPLLIKRDTKGLYRRALLPDENPEKLQHFTGINDPYEIPSSPDLVIETNLETVEESTNRLEKFIQGI